MGSASSPQYPKGTVSRGNRARTNIARKERTAHVTMETVRVGAAHRGELLSWPLNKGLGETQPPAAPPPAHRCRGKLSPRRGHLPLLLLQLLLGHHPLVLAAPQLPGAVLEEGLSSCRGTEGERQSPPPLKRGQRPLHTVPAGCSLAPRGPGSPSPALEASHTLHESPQPLRNSFRSWKRGT